MNIFKSAALPLIAPLITGASLLVLAACSGEADAPASEVQAPATQGLTVTNARLVLPPVAGNPAAVYFDLSYSGAGEVTLGSVTVEGAGMSMIHQTMEKDGAMMMMDAEPVALADGASVAFAPGGLHVMAMQPSADWKAGDKVNVTLSLSDGTSQTIAVDVRAAGEER